MNEQLMAALLEEAANVEESFGPVEAIKILQHLYNVLEVADTLLENKETRIEQNRNIIKINRQKLWDFCDKFYANKVAYIRELRSSIVFFNGENWGHFIGLYEAKVISEAMLYHKGFINTPPEVQEAMYSPMRTSSASTSDAHQELWVADFLKIRYNDHDVQFI